MKKQPDWPPSSWAAEIKGLNVGNAPLGPDNGLFKGPAATFGLTGQAADFIASLLDPSQPAAAAKQILVNMRVACSSDDPMTLSAAKKNMGIGPSKFPVNAYTTVLEAVNAKRVWQDGYVRIWPWPFDGSAQKPDYAIADSAPSADSLNEQQFYDQASDVGDHVRSGGNSDLGKVYDGFTKGVKDKLSSYPTKKVLVIVDLTDNAPLEGLEPDAVKAGLADALAKVPSTDRARLITAIAVLPNHILYFNGQ